MLGEKQLRMTPQRKVLLEELRKLHTHPTADELYEVVRRRLPHISLGTVYRNLEILSRTGMIRKIELGGTQKRFDGDLEIHQHIRCTSCGRIEDLPGSSSITQCDMDLVERTGYEVVERRVEFIGNCPECRERKSV